MPANITGVHIREVTESDAGEIAAIYRPIVEEMVISFETVAPSTDEVCGRIRKTISEFPWLVACEGGRVLAYAYASRHRERAAYRWAVDVSVYVEPGARRRGLARQVYGRLFRLLELQNYAVAYAGIALPNEGSVGLHESLGFEPIGVYKQVGYKFGRWHDVGWWGRDLAPRPAAPGEPLPAVSARELPAWQAILEGTRLDPQLLEAEENGEVRAPDSGIGPGGVRDRQGHS